MTDGTVDPLLVAEPITAWKTARIRSDDPASCFWPRSAMASYGVEAVAVCAPPPIPMGTKAGMHGAPDPDCLCGFYALRDPVSALAYLASGSTELALLKVELSGRVIEHEDGFRAQRQKVVAVWASAGRLDNVESLPVDAYPLEGSEHQREARRLQGERRRRVRDLARMQRGAIAHMVRDHR